MSETKKTFVGTWIDSEVRQDFKIACAKVGTYQGDVIELLIKKWLNEQNKNS